MRFSHPSSERGITLTEVLIATFITVLLAASALHFYTTAHGQVIAQQEISDMQQINRACLEEISSGLRQAGYMLTGHPAYKIIGDSLYVFYHDINPVDTVLYFLREFTAADYAAMIVNRPTDLHVYRLMKQVNSDSAVTFADFIKQVRYTVIDSRTVAVTLEVQTARADEVLQQYYGFRTFINTERVVLRNVS